MVGKTLSSSIADILRSCIQLSLGSFMMVKISSSLSLVLMSIVPPIAFSAMLYGRYVKRLSKETQAKLADAIKLAEERLKNIKTVKAFCKEQHEVKKYLNSLKKA
jgi:ABC-type multidrug transport system fused ATPase/permease subunit